MSNPLRDMERPDVIFCIGTNMTEAHPVAATRLKKAMRRGAKLIVAETMAERDALAAELEQTRAAFAEPAATIATLESDALALNERIKTSDARIAELESEVESVEVLRQRYKGSLPVTWVGGAIIVCLIAGFLIGLWWTDRRSRARHGGIRIYQWRNRYVAPL